MKRSFYTGLHYLMVPLVLGRLKWLARKHPDYDKNIGERFGYIPARLDRPVWIHAVSVGETIAAEPLVRKLQTTHPDWPILLTNTTPTGAEQGRRLFGDSLSMHYAPYDTPAAINRFLDNINPRALVVMETELWPNWIAALKKRGIPILIANARMSEKSAAGYARLGDMTNEMMGALTSVAAQYGPDAQRFRMLGVSASAIKITGNIKADIALTEQDQCIAENARQQLMEKHQPVILAASTHPGEDEIVLDAFVALRDHYPTALLYLIPRHPARANDIADLVTDRQLNFGKRSSEVSSSPAHCDVVIGDKMGELRGLFGVADVVLMGGTLVDHGGHNPLEAAVWKRPILAGPSQRNFDSLFQEMENAGALARTDGSIEGLVLSIQNLWEQPAVRISMGEAALAYLKSQGGAADKMLHLLESSLK